MTEAEGAPQAVEGVFLQRAGAGKIAWARSVNARLSVLVSVPGCSSP